MHQLIWEFGLCGGWQDNPIQLSLPLFHSFRVLSLQCVTLVSPTAFPAAEYSLLVTCVADNGEHLSFD